MTKTHRSSDQPAHTRSPIRVSVTDYIFISLGSSSPLWLLFENRITLKSVLAGGRGGGGVGVGSIQPFELHCYMKILN